MNIKRILFPSLILISLVVGGIVLYRTMSEQPPTTAQPIPEIEYLDNQTCAECHAQQFEDWLGSHHEQAMKEANEQTVLADFNNVTFTEGDVISRFFKKEDKFFVNTQGEDGNYADFEVKYTFGIQPLQQYLLAFPNGRYQAFTVVWDTEEKRWFTLYPDEQIAPDDPLHWTGRAFTANSSCIDCHTTNMTLNYELETDSYHTTWDEGNVSCQACHGPGTQHVQWAREGTESEIANKGFMVDFVGLEPQEQMETCADCHARRYPVSKDDIYGHSFYDDFMPELLREGLYHADGQILDEVYVYGSFIQSKMYHEGVSCMTCHNPHSLKLRQDDNQLCTSCHQLNPPSQQFETLSPAEYDTPDHHFHEVGSAGAQCVNCHMPDKNYMVLDSRRDHSFPIPRPDLTLEWGTPNACTDCHAGEETLAVGSTEWLELTKWAVDAMDEWYGPQWQERPNITGIMSMARAGSPEAEIALMEVINDTKKPAITRATAVDLMSQYGARGMALMANSLQDKSALVRAAALRGLEELPNEQKLLLTESLLTDDVRGVRVEAAKILSTVPQSDFSTTQWGAFERVLAEYEAGQMALNDHPEGHVNLGSVYAVMGQLDKAESAFQTAIQQDDNFLPAHTTLANFYYQTNRWSEAEDTFREAIELMPNPGTLHYSLGLLLVEQQRMDEALENLEKAAQLMPNAQRLHYNYGLLLQQLGKIIRAEEVLLRAYALLSSDADTLYALTVFYMQQEQWKNALTYAEKLSVVQPDNTNVEALLEDIQQKISIE